MIKRVAVLVGGLTLMGAAEARAQLIPWDDRGFVNISGAAQSIVRRTDANYRFTLYEENATVDMTREIKGGSFFDITFGYRLWKNFGAGFSFNARSAPSDALVAASIPDPIQFDKPRSITPNITGLLHKEKWFSALLVYGLPATDKIDVIMFIGPAIALAEHEAVDAIAVTDITETSSGPTINFKKTLNKESPFGFSAGVDVRYLFTKNLGAGFFVRMQTATANLSDTDKLEMGGVQYGGGLRIRF